MISTEVFDNVLQFVIEIHMNDVRFFKDKDTWIKELQVPKPLKRMLFSGLRYSYVAFSITSNLVPKLCFGHQASEARLIQVPLPFVERVRRIHCIVYKILIFEIVSHVISCGYNLPNF